MPCFHWYDSTEYFIYFKEKGLFLFLFGSTKIREKKGKTKIFYKSIPQGIFSRYTYLILFLETNFFLTFYVSGRCGLMLSHSGSR